MNSLAFTLEPTPPFRLDLTVWALRRRPHNRIDRWDGRVYRRALTLNGQPAAVSVIQNGPPDAPQLQVTASGAALTAEDAPAAAQTLAYTLDIHRDLSDFYALAASDPQLGPLAARFRGMKPPRYPTLYECLVNAITCQQVTLALGLTLVNRLAISYGPAVTAENDDPLLVLPRPEALIPIPAETWRIMQFSRQKARALTGLSAAVVSGELDLEALAGEDGETVQSRLRQLWGVGRWTAEYALLRGLGRLEIFPGDDSGAVGGLQRWLGLTEKLDYAGAQAVLRRWQPYAGLVYFHLLLNGLAREGAI
ncbi:MAG TPA: DNA-3-methyladenine glycosylase 2 family protein [Anaerolineae bacterium]|nr:DNA-3-methyladenine glycosylase 2 family protein [Anaerolineae bacterium]HNU03622.1 DNA-3-methyladenine glycosylase 2 family protein [Anaerolineae bacterium]